MALDNVDKILIVASLVQPQIAPVTLFLLYARYKAKQSSGTNAKLAITLEEQYKEAVKFVHETEAEKEEAEKRRSGLVADPRGSASDQAAAIKAASVIEHTMNDAGKDKGTFTVVKRKSNILGCEVDVDDIEVNQNDFDNLRKSFGGSPDHKASPKISSRGLAA